MDDQKTLLDLQHAAQLGVLTITALREAVYARATPEQVAQVQKIINSGKGLLALYIVSNGIKAHMELGVVDASMPSALTSTLIKFDTPLDAALVPAEKIEVIDHSNLH